MSLKPSSNQKANKYFLWQVNKANSFVAVDLTYVICLDQLSGLGVLPIRLKSSVSLSTSLLYAASFRDCL